MADDRYDWLDKDAAERLLRGEPVDAPGAGELAGLLDAAAAQASTPQGGALPGEEAALAAFRQARAAAPATEVGAVRATVGTRSTRDARARTGFARPFRRGFMVALAGCALGGVAVAAGTGVLPTPFRASSADPEPAPSISAAVSPGPRESRGPGAATGGATPIPDVTPGATGSAEPGEAHSTGSAVSGGADAGVSGGGANGREGEEKRRGGAGTDDGERERGNGSSRDDDEDKDEKKDDSGDRRHVVHMLCRDYESGRRPAMDRETLRRLERAAGGRERVHAFCRQYLARGGGNASAGGGNYQGGGAGDGGDRDGPDGGRGGKGGGNGHGHGGGNGHGGGRGDGDDDGRRGHRHSPGVTFFEPLTQ